MNRTPISSSELRKLFQKDFPEIYELASSNNFKGISLQKPYSQFLLNLAEKEGTVIHDLQSGTDITLSTLSYLYRFLNADKDSEQFFDGALDIFFTLWTGLVRCHPEAPYATGCHDGPKGQTVPS